jgi:hypothetical protein
MFSCDETATAKYWKLELKTCAYFNEKEIYDWRGALEEILDEPAKFVNKKLADVWNATCADKRKIEMLNKDDCEWYLYPATDRNLIHKIDLVKNVALALANRLQMALFYLYNSLFF